MVRWGFEFICKIERINCWERLLRSDAGLFFCVQADYLSKIFISFFHFEQKHTISSIHWYILAVGTHALRKTPYLPIRICHASAVYLLEESFHSRHFFWYYWQIDSTLSTRKTPQRRRYHTNNTPPTWKTYEFSRHRSMCFKGPRRLYYNPILSTIFPPIFLYNLFFYCSYTVPSTIERREHALRQTANLRNQSLFVPAVYLRRKLW